MKIMKNQKKKLKMTNSNKIILKNKKEKLKMNQKIKMMN